MGRKRSQGRRRNEEVVRQARQLSSLLGVNLPGQTDNPGIKFQVAGELNE